MNVVPYRDRALLMSSEPIKNVKAKATKFIILQVDPNDQEAWLQPDMEQLDDPRPGYLQVPVDEVISTVNENDWFDTLYLHPETELINDLDHGIASVQKFTQKVQSTHKDTKE